MFYYFRLQDRIPDNHLLRLIDKHISFAFVPERLKDSHSDTGRPSPDPEFLLCFLLIGYLYSMPGQAAAPLTWRRARFSVRRPKQTQTNNNDSRRALLHSIASHA